MAQTLTISDHSRDAAGLKYLYPVISRRAGGLSIGVNFNTNAACNWRCIYCQVPDLKLGSAPSCDLKLLETELHFMLNDVLKGDFYDRFGVDSNNRVIKDIAISGNGEPTSLENFSEAVSLIGSIARQKIPQDSHFVLISNGSLMHQQKVRLGLEQLNKYQGQVWFKLDGGSANSLKTINNAAISRQKHINNLIATAKICPTWLQTCLLKIDGVGFSQQQGEEFLQLLRNLKLKTDLQGVMLYSLARPSLQPEASRITKLAGAELDEFAEQIRSLGFQVKVSA